MTNSAPLTPSLEDYLETIYLLHKGSQKVRVRDISKQRKVRAASVTPALKRLSDLGYLHYEQRELIQLTEAGKVAARRVYARHVLLYQFFHNVLGMDKHAAQHEACGLEHALSDEATDKLVRFFETVFGAPTDLQNARDADIQTRARQLVTHRCEQCGASIVAVVCDGSGNSVSSDSSDDCNISSESCVSDGPAMQDQATDTGAMKRPSAPQFVSLAELDIDCDAIITQLKATGKVRQQLIDTGLLPNVKVRKLSIDSETQQVWILLQDNRVAITRAQAAALLVCPYS